LMVKSEGPAVSVASVLRVLRLCAKKYQSLQKKHVKSGLFWIRSGLSLDFGAKVLIPGCLFCNVSGISALLDGPSCTCFSPIL